SPYCPADGASKDYSPGNRSEKNPDDRSAGIDTRGGYRGNSDRGCGVEMKVAVIGVGHVGKEQARLYAELPDVELAGVVDVIRSRAEEVAALYNTTPFTDYREVLGKVDAATLAVPTVDHGRIGSDLLDNGVDVLVEKPIAANLEE